MIAPVRGARRVFGRVFGFLLLEGNEYEHVAPTGTLCDDVTAKPPCVDCTPQQPARDKSMRTELSPSSITTALSSSDDGGAQAAKHPRSQASSLAVALGDVGVVT